MEIKPSSRSIATAAVFNQEILAAIIKRIQTGRSDQAAMLPHFNVNGSNNAVASRIGTSETGQISDFTTISGLLGQQQDVQAVSDGLDNEIIVRGSFSNSTVDVGPSRIIARSP